MSSLPAVLALAAQTEQTLLIAGFIIGLVFLIFVFWLDTQNASVRELFNQWLSGERSGLAIVGSFVGSLVALVVIVLAVGFVAGR